MSETGTTTLDRQVFDTAVEQARDDSDVDYAGWWCITTSPYPCPAEGCSFVAEHVTAAHLIVVWPDQYDRKLLSVARDAREAGRHPFVREYEVSMGRCISYDLWRALGGPVHGVGAQPDGWENLKPL